MKHLRYQRLVFLIFAAEETAPVGLIYCMVKAFETWFNYFGIHIRFVLLVFQMHNRLISNLYW